MLEQYYDGELTAYTRSWALALEASGIRDSVQAVGMEEQLLQALPPGSLAAAIGEELVLDSAARIRDLNTEANAYFRQRAFRER